MSGDLTGARVVLSVGEPWDFSSSDGDNRLDGRVLDVVSEEDGRKALRLSVTPFQLEETWHEELLASPRYVGEDDAPAILKSKGKVTCNFSSPKPRTLILVGSVMLGK